MTGMVARVNMQIRLPADLHAELLALAQAEERSINGQLVYILRQALGNQNGVAKRNGRRRTPAETAGPESSA
jgi:hypothetical protein